MAQKEKEFADWHWKETPQFQPSEWVWVATKEYDSARNFTSENTLWPTDMTTGDYNNQHTWSQSCAPFKYRISPKTSHVIMVSVPLPLLPCTLCFNILVFFPYGTIHITQRVLPITTRNTRVLVQDTSNTILYLLMTTILMFHFIVVQHKNRPSNYFNIKKLFFLFKIAMSLTGFPKINRIYQSTIHKDNSCQSQNWTLY